MRKITSLRGPVFCPARCLQKALRRMAFPSLLPTATMIRLHHALQPLEWPSNVVFFSGAMWEAHPYSENGQQIALVHGISFAHPARKGETWPGVFSGNAANSCFQPRCPALFPLMTATVTPPVRNRIWFQRTGCLWALGHVHKGKSFPNPRQLPIAAAISRACISMSRGPKGCNLVTATPVEGGWDFEADFRHLGPVQWETVEV